MTHTEKLFALDLSSSGSPLPIFLDFEGVLRPVGCSAGLVCAANLVPPLMEAEALGLRPILVIASTYRLDYPTSSLARILEAHAPGLGRFVLSSTPTSSNLGLTRELAAEHALAPRLFETRAWLDRARLADAPWIAIDDTADLYRRGGETLPDEVLLCDPRRGFDQERSDELLSRLRLVATTLAARKYFEAADEDAESPQRPSRMPGSPALSGGH